MNARTRSVGRACERVPAALSRGHVAVRRRLGVHGRWLPQLRPRGVPRQPQRGHGNVRPRFGDAGQPGRGWAYGEGISVVGRLIEVWSRVPYDEFVRAEVLQHPRQHLHRLLDVCPVQAEV